MTDKYVRIQDAVEAIGEEYVPRTDFERGMVSQLSCDKAKIKALPSADVVKVVRCKNCKYSEIQTFRGSVERLCFYNGVNLSINPDDFCCWGARREE